MCYFHVKQACQVKLKGKPMKEQKDILHDIDELHSTTSQTQWNSGSAFNKWKVFCYPPGVANTNNSLESFNAKRSYTNHTRHTMSALYDIIHDRLLVDLSREVIHGHKVFQLKHELDRAALLKGQCNQ
jgi:hypothetical protein